MCERHWEEIKTIAQHWGGPAPFEYDEAEQHIVGFFANRLHRLPAHEQATLCMGLIGVDELTDGSLSEAAESFELDALRFDQILNILMEDLMSFVDSGQAPEQYQASEAEEWFNQVEFMKPLLKYFRRTHQSLVYDYAVDIRQRLVADLKVQAKNAPAFDIADEGCRSHWDEICVMAYMGSDHILHSMLLSTLDDSALRAIKALPKTEQYALWADTRWSIDWLETCDGKNVSIDLYIDSNGLIEAAETVRNQLMASTSNEPFNHDELGERAQHSEEDDLALLQAVADGTHPLMLEPILAELVESAYLRRLNVEGITTLLTQAVNSYTNAMLEATKDLKD